MESVFSSLIHSVAQNHWLNNYLIYVNLGLARIVCPHDFLFFFDLIRLLKSSFPIFFSSSVDRINLHTLVRVSERQAARGV